MANTLTNLIPDTYVALDVVSREITGFIPSVLRDSKADQVSVNQTLRIPITPTATVSDITPAMSIPAAVDQTVTNATLTITKQREAKFSWSGVQQKDIDTGPGYVSLKQTQIAQAIRALVNEIETDLAVVALANASRGYGTAGTTPFGTAADYTAASNMHRILADNGAPMSDKQLVISTAAGANLRGKQGRVIIDEAAFHDNLEELLKAALALLMWGGEVRIISTHNGDHFRAPIVLGFRAPGFSARKADALVKALA